MLKKGRVNEFGIHLCLNYGAEALICHMNSDYFVNYLI